MKITGIQKCSMVDYPGKMAAVLFVSGCNMACYYCHNHWLLEGGGDAAEREVEDALAVLERRRGFLDGVVISGGEPTLQADLERFILDLREMGYPVKLDTNGTRPDVLSELIQNGLIDYVAMDLKATRAKYARVCGAPVDLDAIDSSIQVLLHSRIDYEFRTTMAPDLTREDLLDMALWIQGAKSWVLQQYRPLDVEWFGSREHASPPARDANEIRRWAEAIRGYVAHLGMRGMGVETIAPTSREDFSTFRFDASETVRIASA